MLTLLQFHYTYLPPVCFGTPRTYFPEGLRITVTHAGQPVWFSETNWTQHGGLSLTLWCGEPGRLPGDESTPKDKHTAHIDQILQDPARNAVALIALPPFERIADVNRLVVAGWRITKTHITAQGEMLFVLVHKNYI